MSKPSVLQEYDASLDSKKRCVIKGLARISRYHVTIMRTGQVILEPRVLAAPEDLSADARSMLLGSIDNLKTGKAGAYFKPEEDPELLSRVRKEFRAARKGVARKRNHQKV